jgi:glutamine phosphoribosylpyrophosphate amidotransferase
MSIISDEKCAFNLIYKLDIAHVVDGRSVASVRTRLASDLAAQLSASGEQFDVVSAIPNTGIFYAREVAEILGLPYVGIFEKKIAKKTLGNHASTRYQIYEDILKRVGKVASNSKVLFVDEALLSGTTVKIISKSCRDNGIRNISFAFASPPAFRQCPWGHIKNTDRYFSGLQYSELKDDMERLVDELKAELAVYRIFFLSADSFFERINQRSTCALCFWDDRD